MSVPGLKTIGGALGGVVVGIVAGVILWIPTCFAVGVTTNGQIPQVESTTNKILNWFPIVCGAIGGLIGFGIEAAEAREAAEAKRRQRESEVAAREAERQRLWALQVGYQNELSKLNEDSLRAFESLPGEVQRAEGHLDESEREFSAGAFAPFWESIEGAAKCLARFDETVRRIGQSSSRYADVARKCDVRPGPFAVSTAAVAKMAVGSMTAKRMSGIVRKAQTNFQFSMIYEQRKTNQILVAGFQSLAQALNEMTWHITSAIGDLGESLDQLGATIGHSLDNIYSTNVQAAELAGEELKQAKASAEREKLTIEMLDNIQRHRYPSFTRGGLHEYPPA